MALAFHWCAGCHNQPDERCGCGLRSDNTVASTMTMIGELSVEYKVPVIGGSTDMGLAQK